MDALLDARFQRVESALNTLIDSIASYNPSQSAVLDLVAADEDLSRGLEQRTFAPISSPNSIAYPPTQSPSTRPITVAFSPCASLQTRWTRRSSPPSALLPKPAKNSSLYPSPPRALRPVMSAPTSCFPTRSTLANSRRHQEPNRRPRWIKCPALKKTSTPMST